MATQEYPGADLSLSQLAFALNERLKCTENSSLYVIANNPRLVPASKQDTDFPNSFTFDDVSQLDRDVSTALANIREWRNSFAPVNRVPWDILSLVPTYLSSQRDRFYSTFVCRHWRRTFLQQGVIWSQLVLKKGEAYARTILERAKGSAIDVLISDNIRDVQLLPPHAQQIRSISFVYTHWEDVQQFFRINSGPLPLLHTLTLEGVEDVVLDPTDPITPPLNTFFSIAINVKAFALQSLRGYPLLRHFSFQNLTAFEFTAIPLENAYHPLELLDFLEASPTLRTVSVLIMAQTITLDGIPGERIVVLPDVETFSLIMQGGAGAGYELVTHISCPSVKRTSLLHRTDHSNAVPPLVFPSSHCFHAIIRQYATDSIEEIALEIQPDYNPVISCSLTFRSPDATALGLDLELYRGGQSGGLIPLGVWHWQTFSYVFETIQNHPLLHNLKRLLIGYRCFISHFLDLSSFATEFRELIESTGPLDLLSIFGLDPHIYLTPFLSIQEFDHPGPIAYPPIKELKISHPSMVHRKEEFPSAIVEFAKLQHARGTPFERLELCMEELPTGIAERLRPWVGEVECYEALCEDTVDRYWMSY